MFIQTESTPNPATLKFLPGVEVLADGSLDFTDKETAVKSALATRLFAIDEVSGVFLGHDFIAVTKSSSDWPSLKPLILGAIMEHYMSGQPVVFNDTRTNGDDISFAPEDAETVAKIRDLIETRVRPAVARDGGDIILRGFKDGVVLLHMRGACAGCPSSTITLKNGIENLLRYFVPEVKSVSEA